MTNKTKVATPDTPIAGKSTRRGCKTRSMTSSSSSTPANIPKPTLEAQVENARKADEKQKVGAAASVSESESEKPVAVEKIETDEKDTAAAAATNTSPTELKNNAAKMETVKDNDALRRKRSHMTSRSRSPSKSRSRSPHTRSRSRSPLKSVNEEPPNPEDEPTVED